MNIHKHVVMKWSLGLSNRVSIIIRRYRDYMRFAVCMAASFITFLYSFGSFLNHRIYGCMFCMLLFNLVEVPLMCSYCSVYSVSLCCYVYCLCVNVYCTAATGCQPNCS